MTTTVLVHVHCMVYMPMYIVHFLCAFSQSEMVRFGCVQSEDEDEFAYNVPSELMATELGQQRKSSMPLRKTKVYICMYITYLIVVYSYIHVCMLRSIIVTYLAYTSHIVHVYIHMQYLHVHVYPIYQYTIAVL